MRWGKLVIFAAFFGILIGLTSLPIEAAYNVFCDGSGNPTSNPGPNPRIYTALGCLPVEISGPTGLVATFLPYVFGIAGTIAFLLMIYGFIQMATSGGDPKAVQGAQETVTAAIKGLVVSLFAIFLLRLIALQILKIPGIS
jgi:hypothetical protein